MPLREFDLDTADAAVLDEHLDGDSLAQIAKARTDLQVSVAWHPKAGQDLLEWLRDWGSSQAARVARVRLAARSIAADMVSDKTRPSDSPREARGAKSAEAIRGAHAAATDRAVASGVDHSAPTPPIGLDAAPSSSAAGAPAVGAATPVSYPQRTAGYASRAQRIAAIRAQTPAAGQPSEPKPSADAKNEAFEAPAPPVVARETRPAEPVAEAPAAAPARPGGAGVQRPPAGSGKTAAPFEPKLDLRLTGGLPARPLRPGVRLRNVVLATRSGADDPAETHAQPRRAAEPVRNDEQRSDATPETRPPEPSSGEERRSRPGPGARPVTRASRAESAPSYLPAAEAEPPASSARPAAPRGTSRPSGSGAETSGGLGPKQPDPPRPPAKPARTPSGGGTSARPAQRGEGMKRVWPTAPDRRSDGSGPRRSPKTVESHGGAASAQPVTQPAKLGPLLLTLLVLTVLLLVACVVVGALMVGGAISGEATALAGPASVPWPH